MKFTSLLLLSLVSIQFGATMAKGLFPLLTAEGTAALRSTLAALILCAIFRPWKHRLSVRQWKAIAVYGVALAAMNQLFYLALHRIPLGITVALEFLGPLTVALLGSRKKTDLIWAFLATAGIALITLPTGISEPLDFTGVLFALAAGTGWGFYILFGKGAGSSVKGGTAASLGMVFAALASFPWAMKGIPVLTSHTHLLLPLLAVSIFSSALPYTVEMFVLKKMPAHVFGILMSLEPAIAALLGILFLGESLTASQWIGIASVAGASAGCSAFSTVVKPEV